MAKNEKLSHSEMMKFKVHELRLRFLVTKKPDWPSPWRIVLPGFLPATNNELLRGKRKDLIRREKWDRDQFLDRGIARAIETGFPTVEGKERRRLTISLILPKNRHPDVDAIWKSALDCLTILGVIAGDTPRQVYVDPIRFYQTDSNEPTTVLDIAPLPPWKPPIVKNSDDVSFPPPLPEDSDQT